MLQRLFYALQLLIVAANFTSAGAEAQTAAFSTCLQCHFAMQSGFNPAHDFAANDCVVCHGGDSTSFAQDAAHEGLIAFPGSLDNARQTCGQCHADWVDEVIGNMMHTGRGMVHVTRQLLEGSPGAPETDNLQSLGHGMADSMLRKLCASCHLGQPKTEHALDAMHDRGGGCLACHINDHPASRHPALSTQVSDARCFGCHARSGRISLNYTGFAEIDVPENAEPGLRLADGRPVARKPADVHYEADMSCIDCHTSVGLMGHADDALTQRDAVDIACTDCHEHREATDKHGTPLPHIEVSGDEAILRTKNTGKTLNIPRANPATAGHDDDHARLTCAACHSQWAPQCFGCHTSYETDGEQWDHVLREVTPGRWVEQRWAVQSGLPALGVNAAGQVDVFVPGMIMTVTHPDLDDDRFVRVFAPLSPHTSGKARSCESCHRSTTALGLGEGELLQTDGEPRFVPAGQPLQDGLAADAWTNLDNSLGGRAPFPDQRPLSPAEMLRVINADIEPARE